MPMWPASRPSSQPQRLRKRLGGTQEEFARALRIPLSTPRNWERRVLPDPVARALLTIVVKSQGSPQGACGTAQTDTLLPCCLRGRSSRVDNVSIAAGLVFQPLKAAQLKAAHAR